MYVKAMQASVAVMRIFQQQMQGLQVGKLPGSFKVALDVGSTDNFDHD